MCRVASDNVPIVLDRAAKPTATPTETPSICQMRFCQRATTQHAAGNSESEASGSDSIVGYGP